MAVRSPAAREQPFSPARIGTQTPVPGWGFAPSSSAMADKVAEILQFVGSEFTESDATAALERAGGDVEEAVAMLLEEGLFGSGMKACSRCAFSQLLFFALQEAMQAAAAAAVVAVARIAIVPVRRRRESEGRDDLVSTLSYYRCEQRCSQHACRALIHDRSQCPTPLRAGLLSPRVVSPHPQGLQGSHLNLSQTSA